MKSINRDIFVSLIFTVLTLFLVIGLAIHGLMNGSEAMYTNMLYYGAPFSVLAIVFSRTADRVDIDEKNRIAISWSFKFAIMLFMVSLLLLITSFFM